MRSNVATQPPFADETMMILRPATFASAAIRPGREKVYEPEKLELEQMEPPNGVEGVRLVVQIDSKDAASHMPFSKRTRTYEGSNPLAPEACGTLLPPVPNQSHPVEPPWRSFDEDTSLVFHASARRHSSASE